MNGPSEAGYCELPVRPEYTNKSLKFCNEGISRQSNVAVISVRSYAGTHPLTLHLQLDQNIRDPDLKRKIDMPDEDGINIVVTGRRNVG